MSFFAARLSLRNIFFFNVKREEKKKFLCRRVNSKHRWSVGFYSDQRKLLDGRKENKKIEANEGTILLKGLSWQLAYSKSSAGQAKMMMTAENKNQHELKRTTRGVVGPNWRPG